MEYKKNIKQLQFQNVIISPHSLLYTVLRLPQVPNKPKSTLSSFISWRWFLQLKLWTIWVGSKRDCCTSCCVGWAAPSCTYKTALIIGMNFIWLVSWLKSVHNWFYLATAKISKWEVGKNMVQAFLLALEQKLKFYFMSRRSQNFSWHAFLNTTAIYPNTMYIWRNTRHAIFN